VGSLTSLLTCIIHNLICRFTRRVHIMLGLRYFLTCSIKQLSHDTKQFKIALKGFFVSPYFLLVRQIFEMQYELNFKVVYITWISWCMWFNFWYSLGLEILLNFITNIIELLCYVLCMMHDVWRRGSISWVFYVFMYFDMFYIQWGSIVVKALCYKLEGCGFDTRWGDFLNLPNPSGRTRPWGLLGL
jgi:hypothetical protein